MNRSTQRICLAAGVAGLLILTGCSSSRQAALSSETYLVRTPDGHYISGDRLGMQMRSAREPGFALALADAYPEFESDWAMRPAMPVFRAGALADHPGE